MTPEQMEGRALAGTPERIVERVREYVAAGVTHFVGMFGRVDDLRSTRLFAERVLPAFR
jgi:alkanesulfonate monooxygenase SsuD/methylene tetrahydromethanopterin reductase-like flavin-dependent oxidoreductase (luciferase family)